METEYMQIEVAEVAELKVAIDETFGLLNQTMGLIQLTIQKIVEVGARLKQCKGELSHGEWYCWLEINLPNLNRETARKWMRLSEFAQLYGAADLEKAATVKQAFVMAGLLPEPESSIAQKSCSSIESCLNHLFRGANRLKEMLGSTPINQLSLVEQRTLKEHIAPLVEIYRQIEAA